MTTRPPRGPDNAERARGLYDRAVAEYGQALKRLVHVYEASPERRQDVLQEIHIALWQSLSRFDGRCALGTWVYRVAHNTATSLCMRRRRSAPVLVNIEDLDIAGVEIDREQLVDEHRAMNVVLGFIHRLKPLDRQIMLLYLEGLDAAATGDIVGLSASNIATKVHRIKRVLAQRVRQEGRV
jgi:RNA polymerase sigma-70 factor (ECF subfamily)